MIPTKIHQWFYHPAVRFDRNQRYDGGRESLLAGRTHIVIGAKATYDSRPDLFNTTHEMAHLIEIDDRRATAWHWGLVPGTKVEIPGVYSGFQQLTSQATEREVRVMAIQGIIEEHIGRDFNCLDAAQLLANGSIDGYYHLREAVECDYSDVKGTHSKNHNKIGIGHHVIASMIKSYSETLDINNIWKEWCRKQEVVAEQLALRS